MAAKLEQSVGWFNTRWKVFPGTVEVRTEHGELILGELVEGGILGNEVGTGLLQLFQPDFSAWGWRRLMAWGMAPAADKVMAAPQPSESAW